MRTQSTRKTRSQRHGGLVRVLFAAVLLGLLVLPLTAQQIGAQDARQVNPDLVLDEPIVIQPEVIDDLPTPEATDESIPDLQGIPIDPDILDDPVFEDPSNQVNDLYVNPILCPHDLDLWSVDYYGLAQNCNLGSADGYELYVFDSANSPWIHQVINGGFANQSGCRTTTTTSRSRTRPPDTARCGSSARRKTCRVPMWSRSMTSTSSSTAAQ